MKLRLGWSDSLLLLLFLLLCCCCYFFEFFLSAVDSSKASLAMLSRFFLFYQWLWLPETNHHCPFPILLKFLFLLLLDVTVVVVSSPLACMARTHPIQFLFVFAPPSAAPMQALHSARTVQEVPTRMRRGRHSHSVHGKSLHRDPIQ